MKDTNLIIGKKNTGKTKNILFNEVKKAIKDNRNLCIFNTRDEYYVNFYKELKENNYNIFLLNLNNASKSNGYNPLLVPYLLYKEGNLDLAVSMINNLALEIFQEDGNMDPFWANMAAFYFIGLTLILFKEADIDKINLGSIQVMISQGELSLEDTTYLKKYLENIDITNNIYISLSSIVFAPYDTRGSIIAVLKQKLNIYILREQLLNLLNTNEINITEIKDKTAIFIIGKKDVNSIANVFVDQLVEISKISFTYILDNFDELKKLICFEDLIKNTSYSGNKLYVSVHNEMELKDKYGKYIIDNFETITNMKDIEMDDSNSYRNEYEVTYPVLNMSKHNYFNFKEFVEGNK